MQQARFLVSFLLLASPVAAKYSIIHYATSDTTCSGDPTHVQNNVNKITLNRFDCTSLGERDATPFGFTFSDYKALGLSVNTAATGGSICLTDPAVSGQDTPETCNGKLTAGGTDVTDCGAFVFNTCFQFKSNYYIKIIEEINWVITNPGAASSVQLCAGTSSDPAGRVHAPPLPSPPKLPSPLCRPHCAAPPPFTLCLSGHLPARDTTLCPLNCVDPCAQDTAYSADFFSDNACTTPISVPLEGIGNSNFCERVPKDGVVAFLGFKQIGVNTIICGNEGTTADEATTKSSCDTAMAPASPTSGLCVTSSLNTCMRVGTWAIYAKVSATHGASSTYVGPCSSAEYGPDYFLSTSFTALSSINEALYPSIYPTNIIVDSDSVPRGYMDKQLVTGLPDGGSSKRIPVLPLASPPSSPPPCRPLGSYALCSSPCVLNGGTVYTQWPTR